MGSCSSCCKKEPTEKEFLWEEKTMADTIAKSDKIYKATMVGFDDQVVRAVHPRNYIPDKDGMNYIIKALKGQTKDLAENGIVMGGGVPVNVPGKMDEGKAIYGSDGKGGGVTVFKTKECILVVAYRGDVAEATRLAQEVAEHMEENGH